jgi:hypothetical protein
MNRSLHRTRRALLLAAGALGLAVVPLPAPRSVAGVGEGSTRPRATTPREEAAKPLPPARRLCIRVKAAAGSAGLLDPGARAWDEAPATHVLLNRTPRIYQTEKQVSRKPPALEVRAFRTGAQLLLRLRWDDPTRDAPQAPARRSGAAGAPKFLYKRPTGATSSFADAAAVMVPKRWTGPDFPSLVMGDRRSPVLLYYWNASRGVEQLTAAGRATLGPAGKGFPHQARHMSGQWALTAEVSLPPDGCPVAFAIWDGRGADRDGKKWFSIWYVLKRE